jgi:hypothetical protein
LIDEDGHGGNRVGGLRFNSVEPGFLHPPATETLCADVAVVRRH